jgi:hypothetical protein
MPDKRNRQNFLRNAIALSIVLLVAASAGIAQVNPPPPSPIVSLSANQSLGPSSFAGWPLVFQVDLFHPDAMTTDQPVNPILLKLDTGSWADAVKITILDSSGVQQNWPLHLLLRPTGADASLSLDSETSGQLAWWVSSADTSSIAAGTYQVIATLDTTGATDPNAFNGQASSAVVTLTFANEPSTLTPEQLEKKYLLFAFYDVLQGNTSQALTDVDNLLAAQPQNLTAMVAKGDLLQQSGKTADALTIYDQAIAAFYATTPDAPEPPVELLNRGATLRTASLSQAGVVAQPHVVIQLQNFSLQAPGIYALDLQLTNTGSGAAQNLSISQIAFATLGGTGQVAFDTSIPPQLPTSTNALQAGASATLHFSVSVPSGVTSFSATETATVQDSLGTSFPISGSQTIYPTNRPPSANAGPNQVLEATSAAGAFVVLSGSGSDPDNNPLTFTWAEGGLALGSGAQITVTLLIAVHTITLTADDGHGGTGTSVVMITVQDTKPPSLTLPQNMALKATSPAGAVAVYVATAMDLVDGARQVNCSPASGSTFALGTTLVNCNASDTRGNFASGSFSITVRDTTPPVIKVLASPKIIWPANNKMVPINVAVLAQDIGDQNPAVTLVSIVSNDPDDDLRDIREAAYGTDDRSFLLRARKADRGKRRVYIIEYRVTDHSGNSAIATTKVYVPRDAHDRCDD